MYQVKFNGKEYVVYRQDGMREVARFTNGAQAQVKAAILNQQWNEQQGKKHVPDPPPGQGVSY